MTPEVSIGASSTPSDAGMGTPSVDTPTTQDTSGVPPGQTASTASAADVQGKSPTTEPDPLEGVPSLDELNGLPDTAQYKKSLIQMRQAIDSQFKPRLQELTEKFQPYEPILDRFEKPEELQSLIDFQSSLTGWENDPETGQLIPATQMGAQQIVQSFPQHAPYLTSDLLDMKMIDPATGQQSTGVEIMLWGIASDPQERQLALRILGGVEPTQLAPQWQPTAEELEIIPEDPANPTPEEKELQNLYRTLSFEKRGELKLASPEFVRDYLKDQQLKQELTREREQTRASQQEQQQRREQYVAQQANQAGESYVSERLTGALTTFHQSVVQECQFIQPLDPANLPQGVTPEQAQQMNAQIAASNKAEAAQITGLIVSLFNPQTAAHVVPLLKEIGALDDKLLADLNETASKFGNNARNFGHLSYRGKLTANGQGYNPTPDVTGLNNEADRALKRMVAYANQIKAKVMEHRSNFFSLKANEHNSTLNGSPTVRPSITGQDYDPTKAVSTGQPAGWLSRSQINQQFG